MSWVGVDFDGTLCRLRDGLPVSSMVNKIRYFRKKGVEVRICTARVASKYPEEHREQHRLHIERWCTEHVGEILPVTSEKDYEMVLLYDDRAVAVETDTGACKGWLGVVQA